MRIKDLITGEVKYSNKPGGIVKVTDGAKVEVSDETEPRTVAWPTKMERVGELPAGEKGVVYTQDRPVTSGGPGRANAGMVMRTFESGATRSADDNKPDYEGYLSPLAIEEFGRYMSRNRIQADGTLRASDNWQKGIPKDEYIKSAFRHFMAWWKAHRDTSTSREALREALCGLLFNTQGYLHEDMKETE